MTWLLPTESSTSWGDLLLERKGRGIEEVLLFITDELPGIEAAIKKVHPRAHWQLCAVHKLRSTTRRVRKADEQAIERELKALLRLPSWSEAPAALKRFRERWGERYPQVVAGWLEHSAAILRFFD